jgi:hypothetical protein
MAGTFLPAGTTLALAGTSPLTGNDLSTRATTNSVQGSIYALAPMLTAGDFGLASKKWRAPDLVRGVYWA